HLVGAAVLDMHRHRRGGLEKLLEVGRQVMQADAVNGRHADRAGDDVLDFLQLAVQGLVSPQNLLAVIVEHLAFARKTELLLAPLDEQRLEHLFERADLLADGGLGDFVDLRRFGKTARFGQVTKNLEAFDLHKNDKYKFALHKSNRMIQPQRTQRT